MPKTVLVVDDEYSLRRVLELRFELDDDFEVVSTGESEEALRLAGERRPDAIILDVMMPVMDGFEVCRRIRDTQSGRGPVIVMLTAKAGTEAMVGGLAAGADDYVVKPPNLDDLVERVRARLRQIETAGTGRLHALPNGAGIVAELERRRTAGGPVAVACLDLNGFERFNTRYGHERGDDVLEWFADLLSEAPRERADVFVGRLGSDDFIVFSTPEDAKWVAESILTAFEAGVGAHHDPDDVARGTIELGEGGAVHRHDLLSVAIGCTSSLLHPAVDLQELLLSAVQMMRTAKLRHGSRVVVDR
ncbi:MAG: GGDEF domain-containing response regulator [Acidimicrobiia bacterium]